MIRYALRCDREHRFESWFGSSADFDRLRGGGLLTCAVCGSPAVDKDLMAPSIAQAPSAPDLKAPASLAEQAIAEMRKRIEATTEDVGRAFVSEARRIHEGAAPERAIIGEALPSEARALIEEGIPVAPLPWSSRRTS